MTITALVLPNGGSGDYIFSVNEQSPIGLGKVKKIKKNDWDSGYIVFLDNGTELDVVSDKLIILSK